MITNCSKCAAPMPRGAVYYQCSDGACKHELGYCAACGGSKAASHDMASHIEKEHLGIPAPSASNVVNIHLDYSTQKKPNDEAPDGMNTTVCPKCGSTDMLSGFGLMGGGYGAYLVCNTDDCEFFYKKQSEDES